MNINNNSPQYKTYNYPSISNDLTRDATNNASNLNQDGVSKVENNKKVQPTECQTCKTRQYQDGSNDPGVSFKTPGHIDPSVAASVVSSHEQEHVRNTTAKAKSENRKVVSQSVRLETSVCAECGKTFVSGGVTNTVTKSDNKDMKKDFFMDNFKKVMANNFGSKIDLKV